MATDLSERQQQVLALLQEGDADKIIAYKLGISDLTVKAHTKALREKFGATNRTQLAVWSLREEIKRLREQAEAPGV